jgi:8-oxo-dGTP diphosphatase
MRDMMDFNGAKVALYYNGKLLVYLRDNKPELRFANMWDFFGGGRENNESPIECIIREVDEELEIRLRPEQIIFQKFFPAMYDNRQKAYFMVAHLTDENVRNLRFGSEGQEYALMTVNEFMQHPTVIPFLKKRLQSYLDYLGLTA